MPRYHDVIYQVTIHNLNQFKHIAFHVLRNLSIVTTPKHHHEYISTSHENSKLYYLNEPIMSKIIQ